MSNDVVSMRMHIPTYTWSISSDGVFARGIRKYLREDEMPEESIDTLMNNASKILGRCPNPSSRDGKTTGIVIGKVQSGKTSNFISLVAMALDNGYRITVVLGGNKLNLVEQNTERINEAFASVNGRVIILNTVDNIALINSKNIRQFIHAGNSLIIVALKHSKHIMDIASCYDDPVLSQTPTLIIDDEGDQATLNISMKGKPSSSTYRSIGALRDKIKLHCFISVTATPQANILISTLDQLSPDFGELVYPGKGYCGLETFHGSMQDVYIRTPHDPEPNILDIDKIPESFMLALATFFVGSAVRMHRGDTGKHSMLIHPSSTKYDHRLVKNKVTKILERWRSIANNILIQNEDIANETLLKYLKTAFEDISKNANNMVLFEALLPTIARNILYSSPVLLCNSDLNESVNQKYFAHNIFLGGNMLERGITLSGLAVTYITRRAQGVTNVDNTEQRARWFGYKSSYIDVCRVFTTDTIKRDFSMIYEHDEDLWCSLERARKSEICFKDIPRVFRLSSDTLRLTRESVAKSTRLNYTEWVKQNKIVTDAALTKWNTRIVDEFITCHRGDMEIIEFKSGTTHAVLREFSIEEINSIVLSKLSYPDDCSVDKKYIARVIQILVRTGLDRNIDIVFMRHGIGQTRQLYDDGIINQLFQGRSPNRDIDDPLYYPGDSEVNMARCNKLQLQIHMVHPRGYPDNIKNPALAIFFPLGHIMEMNKYVVGEKA